MKVASGNCKLRHLRNLKKYMDRELSLLMFRQMILPTFEYCDFVLESGPEGLVQELQTVQNHCLRYCLGIADPRLITRVALHVTCKCKWLHDRRRINLLCLMYKHSRNADNLIIPTRVLRSYVQMKIKLQRPKSQLYRDSPLHRGAALWDKVLPPDQELMSLDLFMAKMKL